MTQTAPYSNSFDPIPKSNKATAENDYMAHPAYTAWTRLHAPWKRCLELAWAAYGAARIPVGAVVTDLTNRIVAEGPHPRLCAAAGLGSEMARKTDIPRFRARPAGPRDGLGA
ncbi:MAG TPA: hypothetical protein VFA00_02625 [Actinomycetota bacterium]|nr:hypothetical protein [Actinomycetota bacterium]